ncbi:MAG: histidine phosphatase family protein [Candidatus Gastranaerophilales bacterium]|nr:histidine phosphatase family protein [Candidatus Gastranaerophilales bacterium]
MKLYLIRHAESYGNIKGKIISTTDFELTEKGIAQSQRIGQKICSEIREKPISAYCSSLARARQTLMEILCCIGKENAEITETDLLKEMDLGLLEGMTWEERRQRYPEVDLDKKLSLLQAPCGESYQDVKNRCKMFAENYLEKEANEKNIIIVSHGITLRILTNFLLKRPDEDINFLNWMENTALTELVLEKESRTYQLVRLNDYSHLRELQTAGYEEWGLFATRGYWTKFNKM